jgi:hypothetical protein
MIKWLKKSIMCGLFMSHAPPVISKHRMFGDISVCKRCARKIKLRSNGEWELW